MHYPDTNDDDISYLDINSENTIAIPMQEKIWAQIGEDLTLAYIDWQMIEALAKEFDRLHKENKDKTQSHVMCKLLVLVREQAKKENDN